jgi:hypothetical protein
VSDRDEEDVGAGGEAEENTDEAEDGAEESGKTDVAGAREAKAADPGAGRRRLLSLLLPPVLALGAVGVHYWVNVPPKPPVENPNDQGAKKTAAEKRKERAEKRRLKRMHQPRAGAELDALLERYDGTDFEKEPVVGKWARQTQTMLNKAIVMSRKAAFEGAPEEPRVSVVRTQCRSIRCRFLLRSPYPHEVRLLANTMRRLETLAGENIWLRFEVEPGEAPAGKKDDEDEDTYLQVTVVFIADGIESDELIIGDKPEGEDDEDVEPPAGERTAAKKSKEKKTKKKPD